MFQNPHLLKVQLPTDASLLSQAIQLAIISDGSQRDVRYLQSYLMRLRRIDPRLRRHIERRKTMILAANWDILAWGDADEQKALDAKRRVTRVIKKLFAPFIDAEMHGVSLTRLIWRPSAAGLIADVDKLYAPVELEYNEGYFLNTAILEDAEAGRYTRREVSDDERHLYIVHSFDKDEPGGLLRNILFIEFILNQSYQEWSVFIQKLKGIIQGKYKPGTSKEEKDAMKESLEGAVEHNFFMGSDLLDFVFHNLSNVSSESAHKSFQNELKNDIEIAITGASSLVTDTRRNAPTVQYQSEEDIARWGRESFAEIMNEQLLAHDYYMNCAGEYGAELPYRFVWASAMTEDRAKMGRLILDAVESGVPVSNKEFSKWTGITIAKEGDDVISIPQPYEGPHGAQD